MHHNLRLKKVGRGNPQRREPKANETFLQPSSVLWVALDEQANGTGETRMSMEGDRVSPNEKAPNVLRV